MDSHFIWLIAGIVLIVAELLTGTFYLLFLGLSAVVASAAAFMGTPFWTQAVVFAACAVAGVMWADRHRRSLNLEPMPPLDVGQPVSFETWVSAADKVARVRYRDASWDAQVSGELGGEPGEILYITGIKGSTLHVAKSRPA